jgi:hypothetical protein
VAEPWFTDVADELARCLVDAERGANACESYVQTMRDTGAGEPRVVEALVGPAAVARVLIDLIDDSPDIVLAAARLCRDSGRDAVRTLEELGREDTDPVLDALRASTESCGRLLEAAAR